MNIGNILNFVADFGSPLLLTAVVITSASYLFYCKYNKIAWFIVKIFFIAGITILLLKLILLGLPAYFENNYINSPSGHAALTTAIIGSFFVIFSAQPLSKPIKFTVYFVSFLFIVSVCATRLLLLSHTLSEVLLGMIIGYASISLSRTSIENISIRHIRNLLLIICSTIALLHGKNIPVENTIKYLVGSHYEQLK